MHALRHVTNKLMELELEERLLNALRKSHQGLEHLTLKDFMSFMAHHHQLVFTPSYSRYVG